MRGARQFWIVLVPLLDVLIVNLSLILCYGVDLTDLNIAPVPFIPRISEIGQNPPTSYIVTFGMTASSLTTFLLVFFRYKQVSFSKDDCSNTMSATVGYLTALSKLLLGAFQYHPHFKWLHYSAFISYVFFSYVYLVTQVFLTYYTKTKFSTLLILTRLVISMLLVVFGLLFCSMKHPKYDKLNRPPYNVAQLAQWTYWTLLNIYTLTFVLDFTNIRVSWNIRTSAPHVRQLTCEEKTDFEEYSHELYSAESESSSQTHVVMGRNCSASCDFGIPRELTTKV